MLHGDAELAGRDRRRCGRRRGAGSGAADPVGLQLGDLGRADPGDGELGRHEEEVAGDQDDDQCKLNEHRDRTTRPTAPPHRGRSRGAARPRSARPRGPGRTADTSRRGGLGSTSRAVSAEDRESSPGQLLSWPETLSDGRRSRRGLPSQPPDRVDPRGGACRSLQRSATPPLKPGLTAAATPRPVTAPGAAGRA